MKLTVSNIYKSYGAQDVLSGASLQIRAKEKVALVGKNGCGKTTLLKIIDGSETMDQGSRVLASGLQIGYLSQISFVDQDITVYDELLKAFDKVRQLEQSLREQEEVLKQDHEQRQLDKYAKLLNEFELYNGYGYDTELRSVFFHFQFTEEDLYKPLSQFSSGQKTRIALVKLLLSKPDILLLDEPTNHLDIESIEWLEGYLKGYPFAVILVSHDRMFLDHVVDEIVEIEFGRTTRYVGNYSKYLKDKEEYLQKNHEAYLRQQKEIERLEALIEKFRYKKNKASFAKSKQKYLDRMDRIRDVKADSSMMKARFYSYRKGGNDVLEAEHLQIGYDEVLCEVNVSVHAKDRMAIVGPNGIGKSTLVKTLVRQMEPISGSFTWGHQIDVGYFDQESAQKISNKTVIDELWDRNPMATQTEIRNTLAVFLFTQDDVFKDVASLSGGERVRLALACLMMDHDNMLILDEPTNHLDIPSKEALEKSLQDYDGTILFVSHDRMFLKKMATHILEIGQECHLYPFGYDEYLTYKQNGQIPEETSSVGSISSSKTAHADHKALKNRITKLESLLEKAEAELEELRNLRYEPEYYQDFRQMEKLNEQIDQKHNEINAYLSEWEEKMEQME